MTKAASAAVAATGLILANLWYTKGLRGVSDALGAVVEALPGGSLVAGSGSSRPDPAAADMSAKAGVGGAPAHAIPETGLAPEAIVARLREVAALDDSGELPSDPAALALVVDEAVAPRRLAGLAQLEREVVAMAAGMLHGDAGARGVLTSGGTESILCAMLSYRQMARRLRPDVTAPEVVCPITIHPAHEKAAEYFGIKMVHTPIKEDGSADVAAMEAALTRNTIAVFASATSYPAAVLDPIEEVGALAQRYGLPFHVDGCYGAWMLPWVEELRRSETPGLANRAPIAPWDFRVPGVTSISADIHKYGFSCKGASVVVFRSDDFRTPLFHTQTHPDACVQDYSGGMALTGLRPGGNVATAWCTIMALGRAGYLELAAETWETTTIMADAVAAEPALELCTPPCMTAFAFLSVDPAVDILAVADVMEDDHHFKIERQQLPTSVHCTVFPHHTPQRETFVTALREAIAKVRQNKRLAAEGTAAMYGMVGKIPDKSIVDQFITRFFSDIYTLK